MTKQLKATAEIIGGGSILHLQVYVYMKQRGTRLVEETLTLPTYTAHGDYDKDGNLVGVELSCSLPKSQS